MPSHRVSIAKSPDPAAAVAEAMDLLGGMGAFVQPGETVLLKPNCIIQDYVPGTITSAEVLAAVAALVHEAGGRPVIGENNLVYNPEAKNFENSCGKRYRDALDAVGLSEADAPLVDLMKDEMIEVEIEGARVFHKTLIARSVLDADRLIDLPVMKTHDQTQVTLGIKNLKGVIPASEKKRSHETSVEQAIVDLCMALRPTLVVVDAMTAAEGMGPTGGDAFRMDMIIAGGNALAVDLVGATVMGFDVDRIKFLRYGIESDLGPKGLDDVDVLGLPIASVRREFVTAESVVREQYAEMGIDVVSENACSGCWAEFRHIYYSLGEERNRLSGVTFGLGHIKDLPGPAQAVIIGNCARKAAECGEFVPGCPPHHNAIEAAARRAAGIEKASD